MYDVFWTMRSKALLLLAIRSPGSVYWWLNTFQTIGVCLDDNSCRMAISSFNASSNSLWRGQHNCTKSTGPEFRTKLIGKSQNYSKKGYPENRVIDFHSSFKLKFSLVFVFIVEIKSTLNNPHPLPSVPTKKMNTPILSSSKRKLVSIFFLTWSCSRHDRNC